LSAAGDGPEIPWPGITTPLTFVSPGLQAMAVSAFFFSLMGALAKTAGTSVPLFEIVLARSLVVAVLSGAVMLRDGTSFRGDEPHLMLARSLFGFAALSCYYFAVIHLPLADASVIQFTNPVFTTFIAAYWLREHIGFREAVLVVASLGGVVLVARPGFLFGAEEALATIPVLVGLSGAVLSASAYVAMRRLRNEPPMLVVFSFAVVSIVLSLPVAFIGFVWPSPLMLLVLLGVGVTTHLGQVFITWGFRLERAGRASAVGYLQIVFAAAWGWLFFADVPGVWTFVGAAVIVGCTLLLVRVHPVH